LARVTSRAVNKVRKSPSAMRSGWTKMSCTRSRTDESAFAKAVIAAASRRAATAPVPLPLPARRLSASTVEPIMLTFCASVDGGLGAAGLSKGSRIFAAF